MKTFSRINNIKCLEWGISVSHGAILDYLIGAVQWADFEIINGEKYYWVSKNKIFLDLALWFENENAVYRRMLDLRKLNLIKVKMIGKKELILVTKTALEWKNSSPKNDEEIEQKMYKKGQKRAKILLLKNEYKQKIEKIKKNKCDFSQSLKVTGFDGIKNVDKCVDNYVDNYVDNLLITQNEQGDFLEKNAQNVKKDTMCPKTRFSETEQLVFKKRHINYIYINKKENIKRKRSYQHLEKSVWNDFKPNDVELTDWVKFFELRAERGAVIKNSDLKKLLAQLDELRGQRVRVSDVVRQSVEKGWLGFFPLAGVRISKLPSEPQYKPNAELERNKASAVLDWGVPSWALSARLDNKN